MHALVSYLFQCSSRQCSNPYELSPLDCCPSLPEKWCLYHVYIASRVRAFLKFNKYIFFGDNRQIFHIGFYRLHLAQSEKVEVQWISWELAASELGPSENQARHYAQV